MHIKDTINLPPVLLRTLISDYLTMHSDEIANAIIDDIFTNAVAINSERDNDGARIVLSLEIPSSKECCRLLNSGDICWSEC